MRHAILAIIIGTGQAHQAMADVRATVDMARCLANHPNVWQRAWGHFDKGQDRRRIHDLLPLLHDGPTTYRKGLIADAEYGLTGIVSS